MKFKRCTGCGDLLPVESFYKHKRDGFKSICRDCCREQAKKYRQDPIKNREKVKKWKRSNPEALAKQKLRQSLRQYGLSVNDYEYMLVEQDSACAICKEQCSTGKRLAVDHCHSSGRVRGLLCFGCNATLGRVKDSTNTLKSMIEYLEKSKSVEAHQQEDMEA